jgi:hypothetical protein
LAADLTYKKLRDFIVEQSAELILNFSSTPIQAKMHKLNAKFTIDTYKDKGFHKEFMNVLSGMLKDEIKRLSKN